MSVVIVEHATEGKSLKMGQLVAQDPMPRKRKSFKFVLSLSEPRSRRLSS
jgi:hypothetical protein